MDMTSGIAAKSEVDREFLDELSKPHTRGCLRSWRAVVLHLKADLIRYHGGQRLRFWRHFLFTPGYKYTVWMRLAGLNELSRIHSTGNRAQRVARTKVPCRAALASGERCSRPRSLGGRRSWAVAPSVWAGPIGSGMVNTGSDLRTPLPGP